MAARAVVRTVRAMTTHAIAIGHGQTVRSPRALNNEIRVLVAILVTALLLLTVSLLANHASRAGAGAPLAPASIQQHTPTGTTIALPSGTAAG